MKESYGSILFRQREALEAQVHDWKTTALVLATVCLVLAIALTISECAGGVL